MSATEPLAPPETPLEHPGSATAKIAELLGAMDDAARLTGQACPERMAADAAKQQPLIQGRLGMASALFTALRCKHPATADHSLRVALECSAWAAALEMPDKLRTQLEAAALLHDIGKIGVPDAILLKPGRLTVQELAVIDASREASRHILRSAGAPEVIIEGVVAASAWYDGSHRSVALTGQETPFLSRMIAIVDAYDSMTTDQVYRRAQSRERALAEIYEAAGTQFDPELVASYCELFAEDQNRLKADVAERWIAAIGPGSGAAPWTPSVGVGRAEPSEASADPNDEFRRRLIENMHDAIVFVDARRVVTSWNTGAERITGVGPDAAIGKVLTPSLLDMAAHSGELVTDEACPFAQALTDGLQALERVSVMGRNGQRMTVDLHLIPVAPASSPSSPSGLVIQMRDVSSEATLEERCQALRQQTTRDPMTQVANRAEFDRMLDEFVAEHMQTNMHCSLIMADIDRFKSINDTYGHQAGDEAIITFAGLMKSLCRSGDLVARYGGEEFAILCADCNNATAAGRAEEIRKQLSETPQSHLGGKCITASFGVTELQPGDTPETMLRRADRALLQAKDQGRNQVVQLGDGMPSSEPTRTSFGGLGRWMLGSFTGGGKMIGSRLVTNVPIELAVDKLRGFIADREAKILKADENFLRLETNEHDSTKRRGEDTPVSFVVDLTLSQEYRERANSAGLAAGKYVYTYIDVEIQPRRDRDSRKSKTIDRARQLLSSLQSYLMARQASAEDDAPEEPVVAEAAAEA